MSTIASILSLCVLSAPQPPASDEPPRGTEYHRFLDIEIVVSENERDAVKALASRCEFAFNDTGDVVGIASIGGIFDDETIQALRSLPKLRRILFIQCDISDARLKQVCGIKQLRHLSLDEMPSLTDDSFASLGQLTQLRTLEIGYDIPIGDRTASEIAKLPRLRKLVITGKAMTDAGFSELGKIRTLRYLGLGHSPITDVGVSKLSGLRNLRFLGLTQTTVTGAGLKELAGLEELETLLLNASKFSDENAASLSAFKALKKLDLNGTSAGDATVEQVGKLSELIVLDLWDTKLTDAGMPHIAKLEMLERLNIGRTAVSDKRLPLLYGLTRLEKVDIRYTGATLEGIGELRKHMLSTEVEWSLNR